MGPGPVTASHCRSGWHPAESLLRFGRKKIRSDPAVSGATFRDCRATDSGGFGHEDPSRLLRLSGPTKVPSHSRPPRVAPT